MFFYILLNSYKYSLQAFKEVMKGELLIIWCFLRGEVRLWSSKMRNTSWRKFCFCFFFSSLVWALSLLLYSSVPHYVPISVSELGFSSLEGILVHLHNCSLTLRSFCISNKPWWIASMFSNIAGPSLGFDVCQILFCQIVLWSMDNFVCQKEFFSTRNHQSLYIYFHCFYD